MRAGASLKGRVILQNNTGHALHANGCGFFSVALENAHYRPHIAWASCLMRYTFPVGRSSYPVTVAARYLGCTGSKPSGDLPACGISNGHPDIPSLPTGTYRARLFQITQIAPTPPGVTVQVVP